MTEHRRDTSALDDLLQQRFTQNAAAIADDGFTRAVGARIRQRRRVRRLVLGAGWVVSAAVCTVLLADSELLANSWGELALMVDGGPMNWGPLLAVLLVGVLSLTTTQGNVVDAS
jgi:hypothetical protein